MYHERDVSVKLKMRQSVIFQFRITVPDAGIRFSHIQWVECFDDSLLGYWTYTEKWNGKIDRLRNVNKFTLLSYGKYCLLAKIA